MADRRVLADLTRYTGRRAKDERTVRVVGHDVGFKLLLTLVFGLPVAALFGLVWAPLLGIPRHMARDIAAMPFAGQALAAIEAASPRLAFHPVRPSALPRQIAIARWVLRGLRALGRPEGLGRARRPQALAPLSAAP